MRVRRIVAVLTVLLISHLSVATASKAESQILRAQKAKLILVGEVLYLARPTVSMMSPYGTHQVVVFRVREVLKGTYSAQKVRISVGFYFDDRSPLVEQKSGNAFRLSPAVLKKRTKWIVFLTDEPRESLKKAGRRFIDSCEEPKPTAEFRRYLTAPCYFADTHAAIPASDEELQSVRSLVSKR